jgi:DNA mismatch repair ATPase MutS
MECVVEGGDDDDEGNNGMEGEEADKKDGHNITFLYTLGEGSCPKSFGINVARLAALPEEVLMKAKQVSANFEIEMNGNSRQAKVSPSSSVEIRRKVEDAVAKEDWVEVDRLWTDLQRCV